MSVTTARTRSTDIVFNVLVGLGTLAVLLQGLWAGIFLEHDGERDASGKWIDIHAHGADVSIVLFAVATVVAVVRLRSRRDLWICSAVLTVLLIVEAYIGGLIRDDGKDTLTAVHVPLAMGIMALAVIIPVRAARR